MTTIQQRFVDLERRKEEYKKYQADLAQATLDVVNEIGVGKFFQDDEGIVYKTVIPSGRFVFFDHVGYERTKRANERQGSLSQKDAKEAGFDVP